MLNLYLIIHYNSAWRIAFILYPLLKDNLFSGVHLPCSLCQQTVTFKCLSVCLRLHISMRKWMPVTARIFPCVSLCSPVCLSLCSCCVFWRWCDLSSFFWLLALLIILMSAISTSSLPVCTPASHQFISLLVYLPQFLNHSLPDCYVTICNSYHSRPIKFCLSNFVSEVPHCPCQPHFPFIPYTLMPSHTPPSSSLMLQLLDLLPHHHPLIQMLIYNKQTLLLPTPPCLCSALGLQVHH